MSGLTRERGDTVIGPRTSQSVLSSLLYRLRTNLLQTSNGVHTASKVGEHSHPQTAQDVPQGQLTRNSISNGPHELEL